MTGLEIRSADLVLGGPMAAAKTLGLYETYLRKFIESWKDDPRSNIYRTFRHPMPSRGL